MRATQPDERENKMKKTILTSIFLLSAGFITAGKGPDVANIYHHVFATTKEKLEVSLVARD